MTTLSPNGRWLVQQLRHVLWQCDDEGIEAKYFLRDNGSCYSTNCDLFLNSAHIETIHTPFYAPNANAHAERFVLSIKQECLNHLLIAGQTQLQRVLDDYKIYFNQYRPHQGIGNRIPGKYKKKDELPKQAISKQLSVRQIVRKDFIGGLLKSYQQVA